MQYAHGDLLLIRTTHQPTGTPRPAVNGRAILAYGEVTGHHHSVDARCGTLIDEGGVTYLTIDQLTGLDHQEHATITLEPGVYEVRRQREATDDDEEWRWVAD